MDELNQLRGFALEVWKFSFGEVPDWILEPLRKSKSLRGCREAANDMVEMCQDLSEEQIADLDSKLKSKGLPSLTMMRDKRFTQFLKVLSQNRIKSNDEFRLVNNFVSDTASPFLSDSSRDAANALLAEYEANL